MISDTEIIYDIVKILNILDIQKISGNDISVEKRTIKYGDSKVVLFYITDINDNYTHSININESFYSYGSKIKRYGCKTTANLRILSNNASMKNILDCNDVTELILTYGRITIPEADRKAFENIRKKLNDERRKQFG